jgi:FlaA1/EpsC-like NDP-sugar epimerase/EAL domain-containing protein (putative c-di-GMP-specific phosphodiesterase class I)
MFVQLSQRALKLKNLDFLIADLFVFAITPFITLWIRLDCLLPTTQFSAGLLLALTVFIFTKLLCTSIFGCYRRYWRFATTEDLLQLAAASAVICFLESLFLSIIHLNLSTPAYLLPRSFPLLDGLLTFMGIAAVRLSVKIVEKTLRQRQRRTVHSHERVIIYGAGSAGVALVNAIRLHERSTFFPVAFVDDDLKKLDLKIQGIPVLGGQQQLLRLVDRLNAARVIIAMPSASGQTIREIVRICRDRNIPTSTLPNIHEFINGKVTVSSVRNVKIEDLLRRDAIPADLGQAASVLHAKRVLVTGAGGSIGSEVCRQVLQCAPAQLILMGHGENSVFLIHQELSQILRALQISCPEKSTQLVTLIADLKDQARLQYAFERYKPDVVFHAAAHKHVPLMEMNVPEAITNNVMGTQNLVEAALANRVKQFVMISTDKAVNPSSVMGASKRLGELIVLNAAQRYPTQYCVVRFGNVLGSRGSVVPIFKEQIERGGPITITHPEVTRYFMTIPEAVQLVLQAMVLSRGGEIFMLNMGYPIKIVDLAQDLIRLSGYRVNSDIEIVYTGLRPGEKMHEELLLADETYEPTVNENLLIVKNECNQIPAQLEDELQAIIQAALRNDESKIRAGLKRLIPGAQMRSPTHSLDSDIAIASSLSQRLRASFPESNGIAAEIKRPLPLNLSVKSIDRAVNGAVNGRVGIHREDIDSETIEQELSGTQASDFRVLYQPVLLLQKDYLVEGFEALLHWQHPRHGLLRSSQFIEMANQTEYIHEIGFWGVRAVCLQLCKFEVLKPHPTFTISVNLSNAQLLHPDLIARLTQIFQETQVNVTRLCFEIPEQFITRQGEGAIAILLKMKGLGLRLLLDNFGFSPMQQLSPVMEWVHLFDGFKIDRSRIHELTQEADNLDFFRTALDLSEHWGLDMIATGIESPHQLTQLKNLRCKYGQGYFFLRPVKGEHAHVLLQGQSLN